MSLRIRIIWQQANDLLAVWPLIVGSLHCKKRLAIFMPPAGMSLTKLSLAGNNFIYFQPGRARLATSRLGTGKSITFFTLYCILFSLVTLCFVCRDWSPMATSRLWATSQARCLSLILDPWITSVFSARVLWQWPTRSGLDDNNIFIFLFFGGIGCVGHSFVCRQFMIF